MTTPICSLATVKTATILTGATGLSDAIDMDGYTMFALEMPSTWVAANLTLQGCSTVGGTFKDVYDDSGNEVTIIAAANRIIGVDVNMGKIGTMRFFKLRSGTSASPIDQTATRTILIYFKG